MTPVDCLTTEMWPVGVNGTQIWGLKGDWGLDLLGSGSYGYS